MRRTLPDLPGTARVYEERTHEVNLDGSDQRSGRGVCGTTENAFAVVYDQRVL